MPTTPKALISLARSRHVPRNPPPTVCTPARPSFEVPDGTGPRAARPRPAGRGGTRVYEDASERPERGGARLGRPPCAGRAHYSSSRYDRTSAALTRIDHAVLRSTRRALGGTPAVPVARGLSHFGEHALGWLALGVAGWGRRGRRREEWVAGATGVVAAHAAGVVVKRVVRRVRPSLEDVPRSSGRRAGSPSRARTAAPPPRRPWASGPWWAVPRWWGSPPSCWSPGSSWASTTRRTWCPAPRSAPAWPPSCDAACSETRTGRRDRRTPSRAPAVGSRGPAGRRRRRGPAAARSTGCPASGAASPGPWCGRCARGSGPRTCWSSPRRSRPGGLRRRRDGRQPPSRSCCFCLPPRAVYLVNDAIDVEADRAASAQAAPPDRRRHRAAPRWRSAMATVLVTVALVGAAC